MVKYHCDRCKKEVNSYADLFRLVINNLDFNGNIKVAGISLHKDLCKDCNNYIQKELNNYISAG